MTDLGAGLARGVGEQLGHHAPSRRGRSPRFGRRARSPRAREGGRRRCRASRARRACSRSSPSRAPRRRARSGSAPRGSRGPRSRTASAAGSATPRAPRALRASARPNPARSIPAPRAPDGRTTAPTSPAIESISAAKAAKARPSAGRSGRARARSRRRRRGASAWAPSRKTFSVGAASSTSRPRSRSRKSLPDRRPQQAEHVGAGRGPEAGRELLGRARSADDLPPLDDGDPHPGAGEVGGGDEPVVPRADDDRRQAGRAAAPAQPSPPERPVGSELAQGVLGHPRHRVRRPRRGSPSRRSSPTAKTCRGPRRRGASSRRGSPAVAVRVVDDVVGPAARSRRRIARAASTPASGGRARARVGAVDLVARPARRARPHRHRSLHPARARRRRVAAGIARGSTRRVVRRGRAIAEAAERDAEQRPLGAPVAPPVAAEAPGGAWWCSPGVGLPAERLGVVSAHLDHGGRSGSTETHPLSPLPPR